MQKKVKEARGSYLNKNHFQMKLKLLSMYIMNKEDIKMVILLKTAWN